jgi:hypothetical protein
MDERPKYTSGPYEIRPAPGGHDAEVYSRATGETVARVLSGANHGDAPADETALRNAALLRAAPQLRESLDRIINQEYGQAKPETASAARDLLAAISSGASERFRQERDEELRAFDEMIAEQVREMSSDNHPDWRVDAEENAEEDFGHSF